MIPSPIHRALFTLHAHSVRALLMGGQACVLYGGAEFSRDADLAVLADPPNLDRLRSAMHALQATVVAVPPFEPVYLERGHAIHFRCAHAETEGLRIDVMSRMRGVDDFPVLWPRRTTFHVEPADAPPLDIDALSLPDLVMAKKTQRDKDWPMIRRLLEANYWDPSAESTPSRISYWLRELRTPELLIETVRRFPQAAAQEARRQAVQAALTGDQGEVERALRAEEDAERAADRAYWVPLRTELEVLRREKGKLHD